MSTEELSENTRAALSVAEAIAAEGGAVTVRAVRVRAKVRTSDASAAVQVWKERQSEADAAPEVPDEVLARFETIWSTAYLRAKNDFAEDRAALLARISVLDAEQEESVEEISALEEQSAALQEQVTALQKSTEAAESERQELQTRADRAEARSETLKEELERLRAENAEMRDGLAAARLQIEDLKDRAKRPAGLDRDTD